MDIDDKLQLALRRLYMYYCEYIPIQGRFRIWSIGFDYTTSRLQVDAHMLHRRSSSDLDFCGPICSIFQLLLDLHELVDSLVLQECLSLFLWEWQNG
jgi:hypothetical protein